MSTELSQLRKKQNTERNKRREIMLSWLSSLFSRTSNNPKPKRKRRTKLTDQQKIVIRALYANKKENGHTQASLAEAYGVSVSTLNSYIHDNRRI